MAEDLGDDSPHAEDMRLILGEIDRLAATTTQLLEFARPRPRGFTGTISPGSLHPRSLAATQHAGRR